MILTFFLNFFNVYLFLSERQSMSGGGAERKGDTESKAGSRLWAVSKGPNVGLELMNREIMTWAEVRCLTDWATGHPAKLILKPTQLPWYIIKMDLPLENLFKYIFQII